MTKAGDKLKRALEEATQVAKCDHELIVQPRLSKNTTLERFYCRKCMATFYEPIPIRRRS